MTSRGNGYPFQHRITDGLFSEELIRQAANEWPADDWDGWYRYDNPLERKRICSTWSRFPASVTHLLTVMVREMWEEEMIPADALPDLSLYGNGMCSMGCADHLDVHLDHDIHPVSGMERKTNAVLFLEDFHKDWEGRLEFWTSRLVEPQIRIVPLANRLVLWKTTDVSYHGVSRLKCPPDIRRKVLTLAWYGASSGEAKRPRALFVPTANEISDPIKDELRMRRVESRK